MYAHDYDRDNDGANTSSANAPLLPTTVDTYREEKPSSTTRRSLHLRRPRLVLLALFLLLFSLALFLARGATGPIIIPLSTEDLIDSFGPFLRTGRNITRFPTDEWLRNPTTRNHGFVPFNPSQYSPLLSLPQPQLAPTPASSLPVTCLDSWVSSGVICAELEEYWTDKPPRFDVVWTWTNGSDPNGIMALSRSQAASPGRALTRRLRRSLEKLKRAFKGAESVARFREHDELKFSMRSVLTAFPNNALRTFHLVTGDVPACSPTDKGVDVSCADVNHVEVPYWLDFMTIKWNASRIQDLGDSDEDPNLRIHPHSELFKSPGYDVNQRSGPFGPESLQLHHAERWRARNVPSFNSLAIESQIINIEDLAPITLQMNDDFFILNYMSTADVYSPLAGPMLRMQRNMPVTGSPPGESKANPDGEWKGLNYAAWLLDRRFGQRARPYMTHQARTVSTPIWREAQEVFIRELTKTGESRFRGNKVEEVQMWFLLAHYTVEKHREALLWSFLFGRSDENNDGYLDQNEKIKLLNNLGTIASDIDRIRVVAPHRDTMHDLDYRLNSVTGVPSPLATEYEFTSADGYAHFEANSTYNRRVPWPSFDSRHNLGEDVKDRALVCEIDVELCFRSVWTDRSGNSSVETTFRRVAFEHPTCGDCIIASMLGKGRRGLDAFLPPSSRTDESSPPLPIVEVIGRGSSSSDEASFALPPTKRMRERCIRLINRYAYTIGNSRAIFAAVQGPGSLRKVLSGMDHNGRPSLLALNDNMGKMGSKIVDDLFEKWFGELLPEKAPWEL